MKFDIIVCNPPYNPNSLWKRFVEFGLGHLTDTGQMLMIHPAGWRISSKHATIFNKLKKNIVELHINDYNAFIQNKIGIQTDWYLYINGYNGEQTVYYSNGDKEILDLKNIDRILRTPTTSIACKILNKITTNKHNGIIQEKGFNPLYKPDKHIVNGKYKQCGGSGNGTGWCNGNYVLTDEPSKHQFEDKVVMSYARRPRAQFFSKDDCVGVLVANYWLTDNQSIVTLLNSNMFWKIFIEVESTPQWEANSSGRQIPTWLLKSLNFDGLNCNSINEMYIHYGLSVEEIEWCEY